MQGWHVQRLFGNGEVGEPVIKVCNNYSHKAHLLTFFGHYDTKFFIKCSSYNALIGKEHQQSGEA